MRPIAFTLFFFSGIAGLIFEIVWVRMLGLVFGTSALALSTVLASYMAGLALGSALGGRIADRIQRPLLAYGLVEGGAAIAGLVVPLLLAADPSAFANLENRSFALEAIARFAISAAVLLVPTTLMGASLPLLARHLVRFESDARRSGKSLGALYATNTAGAIVGALAAGFALLPTIGLRATNLVAVAIDLGLALLVLAWARRPPPPPSDEALLLASIEAGGADEGCPAHSPATRRLVTAAFAVSGAAAMAHQVLWTRGLAVVIGSSVYSFTIVVVAFLVGLTAGAFAFARICGRGGASRPVEWLAAVNLATALAAALTTATLDGLPQLFLGWLARSSIDADSILGLHFAVAMLAVLPPAIFMGAVFPLTMQVVAGRLGSIGRDVGRAYAWNTVGGIAGSFLGGFVLLPALGLRAGLVAAGAVYATLAAGLALAAPGRIASRVAASAGALGLCAAVAHALPRWDLVELTAGYFRTSLAREYLDEPGDRPELLFYEDGLSTTVTVERWNGRDLALKNNGKVDASSSEDMPTQIMVGLLPLLLHPEYGTRDLSVLLIGYASGATAGAVLQARVSRLDVVELEGATVRASRFFDHVNHRPLADPRLRLHIGDGRSFLARARATDRWDVIISEPSNPWVAGVASLFTVEYYRLARSRLRPRGVFCSWAQLYEMAPRRIKSVYRAFADVFARPYVFAAEDLSSDTFLVGGSEPVVLDLRRLERAFSDPRLSEELERAKVVSPHDVPAYLLLGPGEMRAFVAGATPNTDDNAMVEFGAPRDLYANRRSESYVSQVYGQGWPYGSLRGLLRGYGDGSTEARASAYADLAKSLLRHGKPDEAERSLALAGDAGCGNPVDGVCAQARRLADLARRDLGEAANEPPLTGDDDGLEPPRPPAGLTGEETARFARDYALIERHIAARRFATALDVIESWPGGWLDDPGPEFELLRGFLLYRSELYRKAAVALEPLIADDALAMRRPALLYYAGRALYLSADY
ncbi:MAG: fused MFS/spermidine synthase, partial [Myxococcota bacterium]